MDAYITAVISSWVTHEFNNWETLVVPVVGDVVSSSSRRFHVVFHFIEKSFNYEYRIDKLTQKDHKNH